VSACDDVSLVYNAVPILYSLSAILLPSSPLLDGTHRTNLSSTYCTASPHLFSSYIGLQYCNMKQLCDHIRLPAEISFALWLC